jgi:hypothetical protein
MELRDVDAAERVGILMHPFVLAAHTKESGASPFTMGKFVYENVLCNTIGAPAVVPQIPEDAPGATGQTYRQRLEAATSGSPCAACHVKIGPAGFAFLSFDPVGRYSATDKLGRLWDTSGTVPIGDQQVSFKNAAQLAKALANQNKTAECVARRMFRWAFGHFETEADESFASALETSAIDSKTSVRALLQSIVRSEEFTYVRVGAP